jgi:hypothetical protein
MNTTVQGHEAVGGATKRGKPDAAVTLPAGVRAAADRAEALIAAAAAAKANIPPADRQPIGDTLKPPPPRTPGSGVVTANFDPNNPNPPDQNDPRLATPQQSVVVATGGTAPPAPQHATPQTPEDWEHQFKSLKGRYDREAEDKRRLQEQNVQQQRLLAQMNNGPLAQSAQGEGSGVRFNIQPPPPGRRVTPQEIQEFGTELMDVVGRRAAEVYEPILNQLAGELNQVKRQLGGVQNTVVFDARIKMYEDLARALPNWDAINNSPQFAHWLDQIDPISHQPRRAFLNHAHNTNTTGQVLDIFNSFLASVNRSVGDAASSPSDQPSGNGAGNYSGSNPAPPPPRFDLRQFAAPGRAKEGQTQVPPDKPFVSRAEIKQFYTDKTQGKYAGNDAEAARIEKLIFDAGNDGRITS